MRTTHAGLRVERLEDRDTPAVYFTSIDLASSANPSAPGQAVTLTATLSASNIFGTITPPSGAFITFRENGRFLDSVPTNTASRATTQVTFPAAGANTITASFSGGYTFFDEFLASSRTLTQTVAAPTPPAVPAPPTPPPGPPVPVAPVPIRTQVSAEGAIGGPTLTAFNPDGSTRFAVQPFGPGFTGGVRVAVGDVTGDGVVDVVAAAGPGGTPVVQVYNGADGALLHSFFAFEEAFAGGVYVAVGDMNGDGRPDVVVTPDLGGGPRVRVFSGRDFGVLADFFGIDDPNFRGGARVSTGDVNRDGWTDLTVVAGVGGGPRVALFDGVTVTTSRAKLVNDFFTFEQSVRDGVYVAVGDLEGDGFADLIFGGGPGGAPRVLALSGKDILQAIPTQLASFFAGDPNDRSGVAVGAADADGDGKAEILAAPVSAAAGGGGVYDLAGTKLPGYRLPGGFVAGVPVKDATGGGGLGGSSTANFNQTVVIRNLVGTYRAQHQFEYRDDAGNFRTSSITFTLTVDEGRAEVPSVDPALEFARFLLTGRVRVEPPGVSPIDVPVTGMFTIRRFPTQFESQTGSIQFYPPSAMATSVALTRGSYDSGGVGSAGPTITINQLDVTRNSIGFLGFTIVSPPPLVFRKG